MISVIIPTINDPHLTRAVNSVQGNAEDEVEFILINDGGKPIKDWLGVIGRKNINIIQHNEILGRRVSINKAAKIATGKYLFILDSHCSIQ